MSENEKEVETQLLTAQLNKDLHTKFKLKCVENGVSIVQAVTDMVEKFVERESE